MEIKKFHLKDFPADRIRVLFKDNEKFLCESINYFGSVNKLADFLSISPYQIRAWKKYNLFIPLKYLKKIIDERQLEWNEVERNVVAYKGPNLSLSVKNPDLPIIECPELFAIIAHLIGDGCVNRNNIPSYINSNKELIANFQKLIKFVFGNVEGKIYKGSSGVYEIRFPRVISDLLKSFYDIEFYSLTAKFPKRIYKLPENYACAIIRAIVDDEGAIKDNGVAIKMKNKYLILQIRKILLKIFGKKGVTKLVDAKDGLWEIGIRSAYLSEFQRKIKLIHQIKKDKLRYAIKRSEYRKLKQNEGNWRTKLKILKLLSDKPRTITYLGRFLFINKSNINSHVSSLESKSLLKKVDYKRSFKCFITKAGKNFLKENLPSYKKITIDLTQISYNNLSNKNNRILLNKEVRHKLFWFLERIYISQRNIAKLFNVHRNTISYWKNCDTLIPSSILSKMLIFLGYKGIDLTDEINSNIKDIRTINGRYKIHGGDLYDVRLRRNVT